jgi:hypothetical protein
MAKRSKPQQRAAAVWDVDRLKSSPAAFIGRVTAKDKAAAISAAIELYAVALGHDG